MNERIKFLKHQASVWCDENIPEQYSEETNGYGKAWEDKFAELIVRECIDCLTPLSRNHSMVGAAQDTIKEHFGVE